MDEVKLAEEVHAEGDEAMRAKPYADPKFPSAAEIEATILTHRPYRAWCNWCAMARGPNTPHKVNGP